MKPFENQWLSSIGGQMLVEGCEAASLAARFGTPLFIVSEQGIRENLRELEKAFVSHWPEGKVRIMPAFKAAPLLAVRRILTEEGAGCDVFGPGEYAGALRAGVPATMISLNGSIKTQALVNQAVEQGSRIVLDSLKDLALCETAAEKFGKVARVMLRLKPYMSEQETLSDFLPNHSIRELTQTIKYGIPTSELMAMLPRLKDNSLIELQGVHIHMGRHSKDLDVWRALVRAYVGLIQRISESLDGWLPKEVDFGGGIAALNDHETRVAVTDYATPSWSDYAEALTSSFRGAMAAAGLPTAGITIEIEPGRALHNETGVHLTRVHNIKQEREYITRRWVEVDTSEVFLGIAGLPSEHSPFDFVVANRLDKPNTQVADIVGCTCNAEWLCTQVELPEVEEGDVIALLNTGSYIEPMAANFNALPRPGTVLVTGDQAEMIKQHETIEQVFSRDLIPGHLQTAVQDKSSEVTAEAKAISIATTDALNETLKEKMLAVLFSGKNQPLTLNQKSVPQPGDGELLLRVGACGVCGSDLHAAQADWTPRDIVMGHEFTGEVVALGAGVSQWQLGDRVASLPVISCGQCDACERGDNLFCESARSIGFSLEAPGAYAQYVCVGENDIIALPEDVSDREGAVIEPLVTGFAVMQQGQITASDSLLIIGAGPIGLAAIMWAKHLGVSSVVVSELDAGRRDIARRCGADVVLDPAREPVNDALETLVAKQLIDKIPNVVIEAVGVPGLINQAIETVSFRGRVLVAGVCQEMDRLDTMLAWQRGVQMRFINGYSKSDFSKALELIASGVMPVEQFISHDITLDELPSLFADMQKTSKGYCKVVVKP